MFVHFPKDRFKDEIVYALNAYFGPKADVIETKDGIEVNIIKGYPNKFIPSGEENGVVKPGGGHIMKLDGLKFKLTIEAELKNV